MRKLIALLFISIIGMFAHTTTASAANLTVKELETRSAVDNRVACEKRAGEFRIIRGIMVPTKVCTGAQVTNCRILIPFKNRGACQGLFDVDDNPLDPYSTYYHEECWNVYKYKKIKNALVPYGVKAPRCTVYNDTMSVKASSSNPSDSIDMSRVRAKARNFARSHAMKLQHENTSLDYIPNSAGAICYAKIPYRYKAFCVVDFMMSDAMSDKTWFYTAEVHYRMLLGSSVIVQTKPTPKWIVQEF